MLVSSVTIACLIPEVVLMVIVLPEIDSMVPTKARVDEAAVFWSMFCLTVGRLS